MSTDVTALLEARSQARSERNWAEADRLRKLIEDQGYQVVDRKTAPAN
jgi:cysteinyl-tRNA synthetase